MVENWVCFYYRKSNKARNLKIHLNVGSPKALLLIEVKDVGRFGLLLRETAPHPNYRPRLMESGLWWPKARIASTLVDKGIENRDPAVIISPLP